LTTPWDPEELEATAAPASGELSASTSVGPVSLTVTRLERSLAFYRDVVGLQVLDRGAGRALLGAGAQTLVVLVEESGARSAAGYSGLYHFALLLAERVDLARWLAHAVRDRVALTGMSDHFVSEALYLSDPDNHGIEIYWDRPRELWEGRVASRMTTLPLDVEGLLGELDEPMAERYAGLPTTTRMGHVHLKVARIPETIAFYRDVIGFALMAQLGAHAAFLSAGGYHHHLGANTWESAGVPVSSPGSAALRYATIVLSDQQERDHLLDRVEQAGQKPEEGSGGAIIRDPSGIALALDTA
jgi:catechol 2,3-dioxygenase